MCRKNSFDGDNSALWRLTIERLLVKKVILFSSALTLGLYRRSGRVVEVQKALKLQHANYT